MFQNKSNPISTNPWLSISPLHSFHRHLPVFCKALSRCAKRWMDSSLGKGEEGRRSDAFCKIRKCPKTCRKMKGLWLWFQKKSLTYYEPQFFSLSIPIGCSDYLVFLTHSQIRCFPGSLAFPSGRPDYEAAKV